LVIGGLLLSFYKILANRDFPLILDDYVSSKSFPSINT